MDNNGFMSLKVWHNAKELAVKVCRIIEGNSFKRNFALVDQIRRSAISVPSNIAEGDERDTDKDAIRFMYIAKGSLAELRTQLIIAFELGYIEQNLFEEIEEQCKKIGRMLGSLIKARAK